MDSSETLLASILRTEAPYFATGYTSAQVATGSTTKIITPPMAPKIQLAAKKSTIKTPNDDSPAPRLLDRGKVLSNPDEMDIDEIPADIAKVLYPQTSLKVASSDALPTLAKAWTKKGQQEFLRQYMSPKIQAMANQQYGKPSLSCCFKSTATLRHVLAPIFRLGYLDIDDTSTRNTIIAVDPDCSGFFHIYDDHKDVDFNSLRVPRRMDVPPSDTIDLDRVRQTTAALMYFEGDAAAFVRWIGGLHVGAYRNLPAVLDFLRGKIDDDILFELHRIWTVGIPRVCNAEASEENFQSYYRYGNHSTVTHDPAKFLKTLTKDANVDQVLVFDERLVPFILNCHVTPQGLVNIDSPGKKPRCVFDSTFRPTIQAIAINDMTTKDTEPVIREINTEIKLMQWLWRLRAQYPGIEIFPMDDDGRLAFRQLKYGVDVVAMHTSLQSGFGVMNTGGTFGDNTTPSNYDVLSTARRQLAQWFWKNDPNVIHRVRHLLPPVSMGQPLTTTEAATITPATFDTLNRPPLDEEGLRLPPPYNHQVDDNLYADIGPNVEHTLACSAMAMYVIVGFPGMYIPDLLSKDKLVTFYTHQRQMVGRHWDTRTMQVGMLPAKREMLITLVREWVAPGKTFSILEAAILLGQLENHTRFVRWAKIWMAPLYNAFRSLFHRCYHAMRRRWNDDPDLSAHYAAMVRELPDNLSYRLHNCIAKDQAAFIWRTRQSISVSPHLRHSLQIILRYLDDNSNPWSEYIGFIIPRDPHIFSLGDASGVAGGGFCTTLRFWFQIIWSPDIRARATAPMKDPTRLQINCLEFVVVILQLAATITWLDTSDDSTILEVFPPGKPHLPILATGSDNQVSKGWGNKGFTSSLAGQALLHLYSDLLRHHRIRQNIYYEPGETNTVADDISRPTSNISDPILSDPDALVSQIFATNPWLRTYRSFLPSPDLVQRITSALYTSSSPVPRPTPRRLGQLVPAGTTGCILLMS